MTQKRPHVVVLGGGFGGLQAVRGLSRANVQITLIDRMNHHVFQPLLYQVASCALNPADIASPIRRILRKQENVSVLLAAATHVDTKSKKVFLDATPDASSPEGIDGLCCEVTYDYLVVATGATHSYFGHGDWEEHAKGLKSIDDALAIRRRVLLAYEIAEREEDEAARRAWLTFVIVGGGPTGVELAGALREIAHHVLRKDFRRIDPSTARVILIEAGPRLLAAFAPDLSKSAAMKLHALGVDVRLETAVTAIDAARVRTGDTAIPARTVLWAAGVAASPLARSLGAPLDRAGRVKVEPDLSVPGSPEVFAIGDVAALEQDGALVPGVAPAAVQGGALAAENIARRIRGVETLPFRYRDKGMLATIGRAAAVAQFGKVHLRGFVAWIAWLFIHILLLIGFRNRLLVLIEWAWEYFTYDRGPRLITGPTKPSIAGPQSTGRAPSHSPSSSASLTT